MASSSQFPGPTDTARQFATTHWSVVLTAGAGSSPDAQAALEILCRTYWYPLYAYVRRQGRSPEDAQDLTQAFFERLLEKKSLHEVDQRKGKFRSFLLASLNHFLADQWDHAHRQKRGGGLTFISLDEQKPEERYRLEPPDDLDAQKNFERRWALTLLEQVLARLEAEHTAADKTGRFQALQVVPARRKEFGDLCRGGFEVGHERRRGESGRPSPAPALRGTLPRGNRQHRRVIRRGR